MKWKNKKNSKIQTEKDKNTKDKDTKDKNIKDKNSEDRDRNTDDKGGRDKKGVGIKVRHYSLTTEIAGGIILITFVTLIIIYLLNNLFLGRFYLSAKEDSMQEAFNTLDEAAADGELFSEDFQPTFESLCANDNLQAMVMSSDGQIMISSQTDSNWITRQLFNSMFKSSPDDDNADRILKSGDNYSIELQHDKDSNSEFLIMWGTLSDEGSSTIIIRSALTSMYHNVYLSNRFLLMLGVIAILIAVFVAFFLSKYLTSPILRLTAISRRMTDLDFDAKYVPGKRLNEVDDLGVHMNQLSETLEETIRELKQANADLKRDIDTRDANEKMRRDFSSSVSHELKTPLALIRGYAEGLKDAVNDDPESRDFYCDVIIDESEKMNKIVQQLLNLNQIEFGENVMTMDQFDLVETVDSVLKHNSILCEQNGIRLIFDHRDDKCMVWADPFFTEQVVTNYVSNAIHYCKAAVSSDTDESSPETSFSETSSPETSTPDALSPDKYIRISIVDQGKDIRLNVFNTGDQIPEESLPHLWEKFYKVDKARSREYGGSGIGLSVVKAIMDSFNKQCGVINEPNGVTFWCELDK